MLNKIFLFFILFSLLPINVNAQEDQEIEVSETLREELHRYMGYEEVLPKYISLPYDVTMNTNVRGAFLDFGFLFLLFLPILLILGLKNKWYKLVVGFGMFVFLIFSSSNSYKDFHLIAKEELGQNLQKEIESLSFSQAPLRYTKLKVTQVNHSIYQLIDEYLIQVFSGDGDYITYPFLFLLFIGTFFLIVNRIKGLPKGEQAIIYLALLYCFLWLILGTGIPWYGILMVALALIFVTIGFLRKGSKVVPLKYGFIAIVALWLTMSFNYRMTNYEPSVERGQAGAIHLASLFYGLGKKDKEEVLDELFVAYRPIIEEINSNPDALVYRVGTFFHYFIDRNNERVTEDNQLGNFNVLSKFGPKNKVAIAKALRKAGYRYMIIDLNTANIDNTPEQSLIQKVKKLNEFLVNNPMIEPIGTDRIIQLPNGKYTYGFSGGEVKNPGSFIAFKIK